MLITCQKNKLHHCTWSFCQLPYHVNSFVSMQSCINNFCFATQLLNFNIDYLNLVFWHDMYGWILIFEAANIVCVLDMRTVFPPKPVQLKRPFTVQPWSDSEENVGNLLMVSLSKCIFWGFFYSSFPDMKMKSIWDWNASGKYV